jgi:hypothetical protein
MSDVTPVFVTDGEEQAVKRARRYIVSGMRIGNLVLEAPSLDIVSGVPYICSHSFTGPAISADRIESYVPHRRQNMTGLPVHSKTPYQGTS